MPVTRTPNEWYLLAERAYTDQHQGCAWCGGSHRVHVVRRGAKNIFSCQRCDFQISFDRHSNRYHFVPGEELSPGIETMLEQPLANLM